MFSPHSGIKLEINMKKKTRRKKNCDIFKHWNISQQKQLNYCYKNMKVNKKY